MTLTYQKRRELGEKIGNEICSKYGIQTRRIERKEDFTAKNLIATFKPSRKAVIIEGKF